MRILTIVLIYGANTYGSWVLAVQRLLDAFIFEGNNTLETLMYFATYKNPKALAGTALYVVQSTIADL